MEGIVFSADIKRKDAFKIQHYFHVVRPFMNVRTKSGDIGSICGCKDVSASKYP